MENKYFKNMQVKKRELSKKEWNFQEERLVNRKKVERGSEKR